MIRLTLLPILLPVLLAGCTTPSPEYLGVTGQSVVRDGREFRVYLRHEGPRARAQVIRMGWARRGDHALLMDSMIAAAEQLSGCVAVPGSARGDSGVLNLRLRCPERLPPGDDLRRFVELGAG